MAITLRTHKRLWSRAGNECAFEGCGQALLIPLESEDDDVVVGKECHIVGRAEGAARAPSSLSPEEQVKWKSLVDGRDNYANLILMCGVHHDVIDSDPKYTVERLVQLKADHERAIARGKSREEHNQDAWEARYATIVDEWERRIDIDRWDARMSPLVTDGIIDPDYLHALEETRFWLLGRVWPRRHGQLEQTFLNFRRIEQDLSAVVGRYSTERSGWVMVDRVYKETTKGDREFLERRSRYYNELAADLAIELTRAVNLVCERVREFLWPGYRLDEGHSTIGIGLDASLAYGVYRPLYETDDTDLPYPGLEEFLTVRATRGYSVGSGPPPEGTGLPGISPKSG
jgi:hypothetical protein